ncbi:hypothetical protein P4N68_07960 [Corynebacterium felinum]|uniref:Uncharacterized protein n=1 Tax=Corynebacterium felinum TaxID=131318 RepID=A0ABU2BER5_9CORY|nr:hypothetical protein [Corynebacterium felinum]MDF5821013.1 hypothetical protein [Corynebacterium felinum]MDR7356218.1 hypothetical protein [Corynebacterium felinum]WJY95550.1 hypothetical protein CFELI_09740 [Corynebacterium felinum]
MSLEFTLDLNNCSYRQLSAFVRALEVAGMKGHDHLTLNEGRLVATVTEPTVGEKASTSFIDPVSVGDATLNTIIDALRNKLT